MTETALKFGPEWLRVLSHGNAVASSPPPSPGLPKYKLAEFRYGREEMLALFDKTTKAPDDLMQMEGLAIEKCQLPLALTGITDEEQRTWARSVNSDAVLRLMGRGSERGGGAATARGGRGGSTERGRGRGRGSYYQRGLSSEDGGDGPPGGFSRPRPFDRSQSMHERSQSWEDKDGRFDGKGVSESGRSFETTWRRDRENDDEGGWRTTASRSEKWERNSWRNSESKEDRQHDRDFERDRGREYVQSREGNDKPFTQVKSRKNKSWDSEHEGGDTKS